VNTAEYDIIGRPKWGTPGPNGKILESVGHKKVQLMYGDVTATGRELHERFVAMGDMTGKTADQIIAAVACGPTSISSMSHGMTLLQ